MGIRTFVENDISEATNLWWTFLRHRKGPAPPAMEAYFHDLYFASPWVDKAIPSLVYEDKNGKIVGFLGGIRRKMSLRGQPIRVACGGNFVVHPEARSTFAGLRLLTTYMAGDQDLSLTDSANNISRHLLEKLGFRTITPYSLSWARPLRPGHYAVHAVSPLLSPTLSATLKFVTKPFCSVMDGMAAKFSSSPFRQTEPRLHATELNAETLLRCLAEFRGDYSLWAEYDVQLLEWLLTFIERMHSHQNFRRVVFHNDSGKILPLVLLPPQAGFHRTGFTSRGRSAVYW